LRVLFVTTEMDDFIRVGGLAAVSAALPRALRRWTDVRVLLPGYSEVVEQFTHLEIIGHSPALAEMPACSLGLGATKDGLPVYVVLCPQLYDRPGNPYGDESGRDWPDNDIRFGRLASAAAELAAGSAGQGVGLAFRIVEAGNRLNVPRMFAALTLISATGIAIYLAVTLLSHLVLRRWHESALDARR